jgi:GNAT superfamily N-acetyltransferase
VDIQRESLRKSKNIRTRKIDRTGESPVGHQRRWAERKHHMITYKINEVITIEQFRDILIRSSLGKRRPIENDNILTAMLNYGNLTVTAWEYDILIGISRTITDFEYIGYLSDLAVDEKYQKQGIGKELIRLTRNRMGERSKLLLLAAPAAELYYPKIGFREQKQSWIISKSDELK